MNKNHKFIATVLRRGFASARVDEFIRAQPDWQHLSEDLIRDGVFYPFYKNLHALDGQGRLIPEELREKFNQTYYLHLVESAKLSTQIDLTLSRLEAMKIKMLIFKGPTVDVLIYDGYLRSRLDLDIVISDEDMPAAEKSLAGLGYFPEIIPSPDTTTARLNSRVFRHEDVGLLPLHVHQHIVNNTFLTADDALAMNMENVWSETELFNNKRFIYNLKPELNIIYLCEHGLKHDFDQLIYLYELERLVEFYGVRLDWDKFIKLAGEFGLDRIVYYGLYFTKEVLSANIPDKALIAIKPAKLSLGEKIFVRNVLRNSPRHYLSYFAYLAARKGLLRKAYLSFRMLFRSII